MGSAFADDAGQINEGYPILSWQAEDGETDPDAPETDPNGWDGKASDAAPAQIDGIYQITSPAELKWFADAAAAAQDIRGILKANLDLNNQPWTPIGGTTAEKAFAGSLDGGGFTISNLYIKSSGPAGLVYYNAGEIKNLTVSGLVIGADYCAGIAARNAGSITDCAAAVTVRGGNQTAGITGYNYGGTVSRCQNSGSIQGGQYVAGIAAHNVGAGRLAAPTLG